MIFIYTPWSFVNCNNKSLPEYFRDVIYFWSPPPKLIVDLTCGLGHSTSILRDSIKNNTLDHDSPYKIINLDISQTPIQDINCDSTFPPIKKNSIDIIYYDPPYTQGAKKYKHRQNKISNTNLTKSLDIVFHRGNERFLIDLEKSNLIINELLKPDGIFILKIQNRYKYKGIPQVISPFFVEGLFSNFYIHDYVIYSYFPAPALNHNKKCRITRMGHGFIICFKKR